jgi:hypothetical protein
MQEGSIRTTKELQKAEYEFYLERRNRNKEALEKGIPLKEKELESMKVELELMGQAKIYDEAGNELATVYLENESEKSRELQKNIAYMEKELNVYKERLKLYSMPALSPGEPARDNAASMSLGQSAVDKASSSLGQSAVDEASSQVIVSRYEQEAAAAAQYAPIIAANEDLIATASAARGHVAGAVNQAMQNQLMRLVETHKFSAGAIAKALGQAVKVELVAVAAKAAVQALYFTALGLAASTPWGRATLGPPEMFFAAAGEMASISAASLAAAAAVNALVGPSSPRSASGAAGGGAEATTAGLSATLPEKPVAEASQPSQVVNVHVYGNIVDHDAFARELVPAIQKATEDGVR